MDLSAGQLHGLNTALSEATCRGITVDEQNAAVGVSLDVLALSDGRQSQTRSVVLALSGVGRIAASLRSQRCDQTEPSIEKLELAELSDAVESFGGCHLHGWEFIDLPDSSWAQWSHLLSLDTTLSSDTAPHVLEFTQEEGMAPRELDLRIWFTSLALQSPAGDSLTLDEVIDGGVRWWAAHDAGDPRAVAEDIAPPL